MQDRWPHLLGNHGSSVNHTGAGNKISFMHQIVLIRIEKGFLVIHFGGESAND